MLKQQEHTRFVRLWGPEQGSCVWFYHCLPQSSFFVLSTFDVPLSTRDTYIQLWTGSVPSLIQLHSSSHIRFICKCFFSQLHQICIKLLGNHFTDGNNMNHDALLIVELDSWMSHDRFSPVWRILPKAIWRAPSWDHPDPRSFQTGGLVTQNQWRFPFIHI